MSKFKIGDKIRRTIMGDSITPIGFETVVTDVVNGEAKYEVGNIFHETAYESMWKLVESRESSSNSTSSNTLSELPEKWCVQVTSENIKKLIEWRQMGEHSLTKDGIGGYLHSSKTWSRDRYYLYTTITFDQFKKWVLKEKVDETPGPHSFTPKQGDQVQYTGSQLSINLEKVYTVDTVKGFKVHLKDYSHQWINIDWFKGPSSSTCPQFTLIKAAEKSEDSPNSPINATSTEQWTPKVGEWVWAQSNTRSTEELCIVVGVSDSSAYKCHFKNVGTGRYDHLLWTDTRHKPRKALPHEIPPTMADYDEIARQLTEAKGDPSKLNLPTNESLLEQAKRKYPVGTKFKCLVTLTEYTVPEGVSFKNENGAVYSYVNNSLFHGHYDGRWAEIIQEPKAEYVECVKVINSYTVIGYIYKVINDRNKGSVEVVCNKDTMEYMAGDTLYVSFNQNAFKPSTKEAYDKQEAVGLGESVTFSGMDFHVPNGQILSYRGPTGSKFHVGIDPWAVEEKETLLKPQPSPKVLVKSHEEFKITVTKPKQIKL